MRFDLNLLVVSAVLPAVLMVAGAPVSNDGELVVRNPTGKAPKAAAVPATGGNTNAKAATGGAAAKAATGGTGTAKKACPVRKGTAAKPVGGRSLHRRAPIPIGFVGTDTAGAAELKATKKKTANKNGARLGVGLYLTDNLKLAETFAYLRSRADRTKQAKPMVCQVSMEETAWKALSKIWFPKEHNGKKLIDLQGVEADRTAYEEEKCVTAPSVRFALYDIDRAPPGANELVIPASMQNGLIIDCKDLTAQPPAIDSDNEEPVYPHITPYNNEKAAWNIVE